VIGGFRLAAFVLVTGSALLTGSVLLTGSLRAQIPHPPVNADAQIIQDFEKRVADYVQLRKTAEANLAKLKSTPSQEKISHHEDGLAHAIRDARKTAKQGDIFTPPIAMEIRRLISIAMQPEDANNIRQSLHHAEPVQLQLKVNDTYPKHVPLQSTPPTLLGNLPRLPPEIEYRVTGRDLVLLDTRANLIVDVIPGVFS
jgi:hypothetical protein